MEKIIHIQGMSCGHCVKAVTSELSAIEGTTNIAVSLENKCATLSASKDVTNQSLIEAIEEAGFRVVSIQ